ncbi:PLP-dependent aminotransferase family protein [Streptomyces sp. NRRL S-87]|uniref:MocR-like pyridoxine biosynthesis transcription factor PdxR n=1 Tax=Streptomyces sp. NRRL S-87 TaxID=1463920 RepID=UPI00068E2911|nr:PLP-dependent aminotransferase family protein [Streptomyces sp. NRRL S-87]
MPKNKVNPPAGGWLDSAERTGADLHLELPAGGGRRAALAEALRAAVRDGRLPSGARLPPYRSLAADLGLARNTVADAYAELVAEGWLTARQGSGTRVAERAAPPAPVRRPRPAGAAPAGPVHDLLPGQPDAGSFPRAGWLSAARRALNGAPNEAFGPGDPRGRTELRRALADYLGRARGVRTDPERIVVSAGFGHALRLLYGGGVLAGPLAVEAYGLSFHRELLDRAGVPHVPLPIDERGADTTALADLPRVRQVLLTAAHQFPTGGPLHRERRSAAVAWARAGGGLILEDDYDGEFRYDRQPIGALQGLDPERVVHMGSVSKSLSPALRLGWIVLPEDLVDAVLDAKGEREAWVSVPDQLTLAEFIASGGYDRHVRRMRQRYRGRRDRLTALLAARAPHVSVSGVAAGLHAVLTLPAGTEAAAVAAARAHGVAVEPLSSFRHPAATQVARDGLVIGYATPADHAYPAALDALCAALASVA